MNENNDIYMSLDEARVEISRRWSNQQLRNEIQKELGNNFWKFFENKPRSLLWRPLISPDNGFVFFYQCSKYINVEPLVFEFQSDLYMSFNEEKRGLGMLRVTQDNEEKLLNIIDSHDWNRKPFNQIQTKLGSGIVEFHHDLMNYSGYDVDIFDMSKWVREQEAKPSEWYYNYLLHFVAHGVLFEAYLALDDEKDNKFFYDVVLPNITKIREKYGISPILVKHYPDDQTDEEDFYWWAYPPTINNHIIDLAKENELKLRIL